MLSGSYYSIPCSCVKVVYECAAISDDINKETPIHVACHYGHLEIVKYLLGQGVNQNVWW